MLRRSVQATSALWMGNLLLMIEILRDLIFHNFRKRGSIVHMGSFRICIINRSVMLASPGRRNALEDGQAA